MIKDYLRVRKTMNRGRGVFTKEKIKAKIVVEQAPVIVISAKDRAHIEKTLLNSYIFAWGEKEDKCCVALGTVSLYNHSYTSNCEYIMDFEKETIQVKTVREIKAGKNLPLIIMAIGIIRKELWFEVS